MVEAPSPQPTSAAFAPFFLYFASTPSSAGIQTGDQIGKHKFKEERSNKGAALTTYLSLAGRYCVLMPNTSHGGGISRKISDGADRKRLKSIMADLNLPSVMGLIVRTAGLSRTKVEIKRDFDYLARLWDEIRERTLNSSAPALIYRDSDLIKRAIRDLYHREIDEVLVEGEEGYKAARGFMKLLMPSHVRRVKQHTRSHPAVPALWRRGPAFGDVPARSSN